MGNTVENLLKKLLEGFYISSDGKRLIWGYVEDESVGDSLSPELQQELLKIKIGNELK